MHKVTSVEVHVVALPMRERFRGITVREAAVFSGPAGWGEFAPFTEYGPAESLPWLRAAHEAAEDGWPEPVRAAVPVNVTVPAVDPEAAARIARDSCCRTAKVKVAEAGQGLADDVARVEAVRDALGPGGRIRVDANAAWSVDEAERAIVRLDRAAGGLEYVEQPCRTLEELAAVRRRVDVPIAADESIRRAVDPFTVRVAEAADIAVIKVAPLGGVRRALEVARTCGLPCVVSSAVDTSIGLAAGVALAAALPELPYACGLGTGALLARDVSADPLLPVAGAVPVRPVVPDRDLLAELAAPPERQAWWRERIAACERLA